MPFDRNSFLGTEINTIRQKHIDQCQGLYATCNEINAYANDLKYRLNLKDNRYNELVVGGLFIKNLQSFNSLIILTSYGLESDAKSIGRVFIESYIKLIAIINSDDYLKSFIEQDNITRGGIFKNIKGNPECFTEKAVKFFGEYNLEELRAKNKVINKYKIEQVAEIACMKDVYFTAYKIFCSNVHTDVRVVENFYILKDEKVESFDTLPRYKDTYLTLLTACDVFLRVIKSISKFANNKVDDGKISCFEEQIIAHIHNIS